MGMVLTHILDPDGPLQPVLPLLIRYARLFPRHIINPPPIRLHRLARRELRCKIQPAQGIAHSSDFIAHRFPGCLAHAIVQVLVCPEIKKVFCDCFLIADFDEKAILLMLDLQWDAARPACNDGFAFVDGLGDFDFESFSSGELQGDFGLG